MFFSFSLFHSNLTQRAIELHDGDELLPLQRGKIELASKRLRCARDLQVAVEPSPVPVGRQPRGVAQCGDDQRRSPVS